MYGQAPGDWLTLTGARAILTLFWDVLGVYIQKVPDTPPAPKDWLTGKPLTYDITHSDELFFLVPQQKERFILDGAPHVAPDAPIPPAIRTFLDAHGRNNIAHPDPEAWTLAQELQVISWLTTTASHRPEGSAVASGAVRRCRYLGAGRPLDRGGVRAWSLRGRGSPCA